MNEKEKLKLLIEAERFSKKNMAYKNPKRGKYFTLIMVLIIYLIAMVLSFVLIAYFKRFLLV